jgi:hypothetical protein
MSEQDRVVYGMSRKLSDGKYGSTDVHFSYSTDKGINETLEQATTRCIDYVESIMVNKIEEIQKGL